MKLSEILKTCKRKIVKMGLIGLASILIFILIFSFFAKKFIINPIFNIIYKPPVIEMPWGRLDFAHEVAGSDIPCIGKPKGYTRVFRAEANGNLTIVYGKPGDLLDKAYAYITKKIEKCGYTKNSHGSINISNATKDFGFSKVKVEEYTKDDKNLQLAVATVEYKKRTYTIISLELNSNSANETPAEENNSQSSTNTTESNSSKYDNAKDLTPSNQTLQAVNNMIKPILSSIFGGAKLSEYNSLNMHQGNGYALLVYIIKNKITESNVEILKQKLAEHGYAEVATYVGSTDFSLTVRKESTTLSITGEINSQKIEVNFMSQ